MGFKMTPVATQSFSATANMLIEVGVTPVPLLRRGKRPAVAWSSLQSDPITRRSAVEVVSYVQRWWGDDRHGIGAVTGEASGIVVVDVDDADAEALLAQTATPVRSVGVQTVRGRHVWFAHPGGRRPNRAAINGAKLDVRGDGGFVVCPPSWHPSGARYEWTVSPWEMWPPAELPHELLELLWPSFDRTPIRRTSDVHFSPRSVRAAVGREVEAVRLAPEGRRNDQLNRSAFAVAGFVLAGQIPVAAGAEQLIVAALQAGLSERESRRTIASAFKARRLSRG